MFILLPLICILGYTYLFHCSTENSIENWGINGCICNPLLRGICDISLGTLIGYVISNKKGFFGRHSLLISLCSIVSIIWILFLLVIENPYGNISLIVFTILIIGCFSEHSIINRVFSSKIWCNLGALSYSMLLVHYPVMLITKRFLSFIEFDNNFLIIALYFTNVIVCSWLFDKAFNHGLKVLSLTKKS